MALATKLPRPVEHMDCCVENKISNSLMSFVFRNVSITAKPDSCVITGQGLIEIFT